MSADCPPMTWILTTFNQEAQIERAILSAYAQDYPNLEIIVSDDCSTDGTAAIVRRLTADYRGPHRVRANFNDKNLYIGGHISLMNRLASGDLVINAAGDDVSAPNRASTLVAAWIAAGRSPGMLHSACFQVAPGSRERFDNPTLDRTNSIDDAIHCSTFVIGATAAWDRAMFARFGDLRPDVTHEDHAILFRTLLSGRSVAYVDEPLVDHTHGGLTTYDNRPTATQRMQMLDRYRIDALQKLADLEAVPRPELRGRLQQLAERYRVALEFERGWPGPRQAKGWRPAVGTAYLARMYLKRARNIVADILLAAPSK